MLKMIKKADVILFFILLAFGIGLFVLSLSGASVGEKVLVTVNGETYGTYSLSKDRTIEIKQDNSVNKITIKNGSVQMIYSTCKNQICVKNNPINKTNQSIICLPNRVLVQIVGGEEDFDAVAK